MNTPENIEKNKDQALEKKKTKIFIIGHKQVEYGFPETELYQPIQVGDNEQFLTMTDHDKEPNWHAWNPIMAENTGILYVAKYEAPSYDYIGVEQYRRRFPFESREEVEKIFENYDLIAATPLRLSTSLRKQYETCHSKMDLRIIEEILPDEQKELWKKTLDDNLLFYSNGFVMRSDDFQDYAQWLNSVFVQYLHKRGITTPDVGIKIFKTDIARNRRKSKRGLKYQAQVLGFLSERLWTMYLQANFSPDRIALFPYNRMEEGMDL